MLTATSCFFFCQNCKKRETWLKLLNCEKNRHYKRRRNHIPIILIQPLNLHSHTFVSNNKMPSLTSSPHSMQEALDLLDKFHFESEWRCANTRFTRRLHTLGQLFQIQFCFFFFVCFVFTAASTDPTHLFLLQPSANDCFFSPFLSLSLLLAANCVVLCDSLGVGGPLFISGSQRLTLTAVWEHRRGDEWLQTCDMMDARSQTWFHFTPNELADRPLKELDILAGSLQQTVTSNETFCHPSSLRRCNNCYKK